MKIKLLNKGVWRRVSVACAVFCLCCLPVLPAKAQATEVQQLLLNVEKLAQFKGILSDMQKGYRVLRAGYGAIRDISQGSFSLHEAFLKSLMRVSPVVRQYKRVGDILRDQAAIASGYKADFRIFRASGNFNAGELDYLGRVYQQLFRQSMNNLDELTDVITSSRLRMSDEERLEAIDRIFADTRDQLSFLRNFNKEAGILNGQRQKEKADVQRSKRLYNLN
jgi:hypothetical protein